MVDLSKSSNNVPDIYSPTEGGRFFKYREKSADAGLEPKLVKASAIKNVILVIAF